MKKLISTVLAAALTLSLAACGSTAASSTSEAASGSEAASTASSETASDASDAVDFTGDGYDATVDYASLAGTTIKVAASPVPHAEILKVAGDILAKADITLDVVEYTDYVQPNLVTESGEVDANYFQHITYMENFNAEQGTHLVSAGAIHYEPMGIYAGKSTSLDEIPDGAVIAVPNDATNEGRALLLLQEAGLITLPEDADVETSSLTVLDIVDNPKNLNILEVEANTLPATLEDADLAVINGNFAIAAGLSPATDAIFLEPADSVSGKIFTNYVVVRPEDAEAEWVTALASCLQSDKVKEYMLNSEKYAGGVIPAF